jgi:hypothetical protein
MINKKDFLSFSNTIGISKKEISKAISNPKIIPKLLPRQL